VVPSPAPIDLVEADSIKTLLDSRVIVITSGGGGIPVVRHENGELAGIEAVVDKDKAGQKLAEIVNGDIFLVLTDVDQVCLNFGKPNQTSIKEMTISAAKRYLEKNQFPRGSMAPKVEACISFLEQGGKRAIISSVEKAVAALGGKAGTEIIPNKI